jgi:acetylornithine/N-succinyldiaminopimelate aminotransferase
LKFNDNIAEELVLACLKEGLLVNAVKPNTLRFIPPLIITEKDIDEALRILEKVLVRRL